ncbi:HDIG domain-containing metalloprotein [Clostridium sp. UBA6640]|uniref:HDIG domain-containing metalloprotein n=1 Tax=Clostridium sp. UBA6640 TaxID=1946370 RepID=UPI0025B94EE6|nr:HDIG domain-containing metalloprotein [Clostridium sp. UBA6640]
MFIYRVKQFFKAVTAKITDEDIEFINRYLEPFEIELFNKLKVYDKKHCINVAKDILEETKKISLNCDDIKMLIKTGLLHDIGKLYRSLNPIEKSIIVVLNFITRGRLKKLDNIKFINVYYNHGEIGYNILKKYDYDDNFLNLIRYHHTNNYQNISMDILKRCDDKN